MRYFRVKNWDKFQQYKDRDPKWIKLYRSLNRNYEWCQLAEVSRAHLVGIWLLAAELDNKIPNDLAWVSAQIGAKTKLSLDQLVAHGFIELYENVQDSTETYLETETETETETHMSGKPDDAKPKNGNRATAKTILAFLNEKAGRNYRAVEANIGFIVERLKEGYEEKDFRQVIALKTREWKDDDKMRKFLRPETLFNKTKFAQYTGELGNG